MSLLLTQLSRIAKRYQFHEFSTTLQCLHHRQTIRTTALDRKFFDFLVENMTPHTQVSPSPIQSQSSQMQTQLETQPPPPSTATHVLSPNDARLARVCIVGMPNAGKSTLLNRLINYPLSAISGKVNTTREQIVGCLSVENVQIEFIDTPGILPLSLFHPQRDKRQYDLHFAAWQAVYSSDIVVLIVDPTNKSQAKNTLIAQQLQSIRECSTDQAPNVDIDKLVLVLNKCDLFWPHDKIHEMAKMFNDKCKFDITLITSAKNWKRVDKLRGFLLAHIGSTVNESAATRYSRKWKFDQHLKTTLNKKEEMLQCVHSKIYQRCHQEVPYVVELEVEGELEETDDRISVNVIANVHTKSHQKILYGAAGKHVRQWAERDLTARFGKKVNIKLTAQLQLQRNSKKRGRNGQ